MKVLLIIPAYEPDETLIRIVDETLQAAQDQDLDLSALVVNDGSSPEAGPIFEHLREHDRVTLLESAENEGKGAALKKAFNHALSLPKDDAAILVTADADGQHLPNDIVAVAAAARHVQSTTLGVREFDASVPLRSRFGNLLTRQLFKLINGLDVRDTQTGLRAIMREDLPALVDIPYNRYEYEIEMLSSLVKAGPVEQVSIETIYEPGNPTSHFHPILDSIRIYWVLFRYIFTILAVSATEAAVIFVLTELGLSILTTIVLARAISVILYFNIARNFVFRSSGKISKQALLFLLLVFVNLAFLYVFVSVLEVNFGVPRVLAAILGNMAFFVVNFLVQRHLIFSSPTSSQSKGKTK